METLQQWEQDISVLRRQVREAYDPDTDPLTNLLAALDVPIQCDASGCHSEPADFQNTALMVAIQSILEEGMVQGYFRPMDTQHVALLQLGLCRSCSQALLSVRSSCENGIDAAEEKREILRSFQELIAGSVRARESLLFSTLRFSSIDQKES